MLGLSHGCPRHGLSPMWTVVLSGHLSCRPSSALSRAWDYVRLFLHLAPFNSLNFFLAPKVYHIIDRSTTRSLLFDLN